jgi:hypothetical protein
MPSFAMLLHEDPCNRNLWKQLYLVRASAGNADSGWNAPIIPAVPAGAEIRTRESKPSAIPGLSLAVAPTRGGRGSHRNDRRYDLPKIGPLHDFDSRPANSGFSSRREFAGRHDTAFY